MDTHARLKELALAAGESLIVEDAVDIEVRCRRGTLWITQYGDTRDVVLTAGRAFELALATTAVLSSRDGAEFVLQPVPGDGRAAQALPWSRRLLRALSPRSAGPALRELAGRVRMERAP